MYNFLTILLMVICNILLLPVYVLIALVCFVIRIVKAIWCAIGDAKDVVKASFTYQKEQYENNFKM